MIICHLRPIYFLPPLTRQEGAYCALFNTYYTPNRDRVEELIFFRLLFRMYDCRKPIEFIASIRVIIDGQALPIFLAPR